MEFHKVMERERERERVREMDPLILEYEFLFYS